jgi:hypothetical protein
MESKARITGKRGDTEAGFSFHRLNKTNRHLCLKLMTDEALPKDIIALELKNEKSLEQQTLSSSFHLKGSPERVSLVKLDPLRSSVPNEVILK